MQIFASFVAVVSLVAGCADDSCIDGVCPDPSETRMLPGPCRAATANEIRKSCDFSYDSDGHLTTATCEFYGDFESETYTEVASWMRDAAGNLASIAWHDENQHIRGVDHWLFDPTTVTVNNTWNGGVTVREIYDRATFAFAPGAGIEAAFPRGGLGLSERGRERFTWTIDGARRIQTSATGAIVTYTLDDAGHIIEIDPNTGFDGREKYTFEGDRLVTRTVGFASREYAYDVGGNLTEVTAADGRHEVYSYDCW